MSATNCAGCSTTGGAAACPEHGSNQIVVNPVPTTWDWTHRHVWAYRGTDPDGRLVMVCDGHWSSHADPAVYLVPIALAERGTE